MDLAALTAGESLTLLQAGTISPAELTQACLNRIEHVNPAVNAVVTVAAERAMAEADAATSALVGGATRRADIFADQELFGLPVLIKDLQPTAGIITTLGSEAHADWVPAVDAGIVRRIRDSGGIVVGKTNIPERSIGANTVNRLFGATANPFDLDATCGGSSGGSAVALATNMAPLATGSDHGGSLRIPASFCGVVGFRATPGVVPFEERTTPQTNYSVQGPMARTVADTALLLSVIAKRQWRQQRDPMAFPLDTARFGQLDRRDLSQLRVAVTPDLGGVLVSDHVRREFEKRVRAVTPLVATVDDVALDLTAAAEVDWRLRSDVFVTQYHHEVAQWDDGFNPNIRRSYDAALATPMEDIAVARRTQMELFQRVNRVFDDFDVLMIPGVSVPPFPWNQLNPATIDGVPVDNYMAWLTLTAAITVVGHPALALPLGLDATGFPFGVQLVGTAYGDHHLLSVGHALEQALADSALGRPVPPEDRWGQEYRPLRDEGTRVADGTAAR